MFIILLLSGGTPTAAPVGLLAVVVLLAMPVEE